MSAPPTPDSSARPGSSPDDPELQAALDERDKADVKAAREAAAALAPGGPCPVCKAGLYSAGSWLPAALVERPALSCPKCSLSTPAVPSAAAEVAALIVVALLAWRALASILEAQQLTQNGPRTLAFLIGGGLAVAAMNLYSAVRGRRGGQLAADAVLARVREREDEAAGLPRRPEWLVVFRGRADLLREVVFCAVLFLLLRHVAVEAYVIPTGSMAPTLLGNNFRTTCPRCHVEFPVGKAEGVDLDGRRAFSVVCPLCEEPSSPTPTRVIDGNKILVDKLIYRLRPPRRWEVVVFHYPVQPWQVFIKRLVGLPGDKLQVIDGDVYVDGQLQRKPDDVQDAIWIPVLDTRVPYPGAGASWTVLPGTQPAAWDVKDEGALLLAHPGAAPEVWLGCRRRITDRNAYNRSGNDGDNPVGDMRITSEVTAPAGAIVRLATLEHGSRQVIGSFPVGGGTGEYRIVAVEEGGPTEVLATKAAGGGLTPGKRTTVALAYADDRARLIVDGETVLDAIDVHAPGARDAGEARARIGASGGEVAFADTRIDRDIYYVHRGSTEYLLVEPLTVPDNCYVCLGDNSTSSADSRSWGFVRHEMLLGRAFFVWWPISPFQLGRVR